MFDGLSKRHLLVDFEPIGRRAEIEQGRNLLEAARREGVDLVSVCGGIGSCNSCRIRLISGRLNAPTLEEEAIFSPDDLAAGYRLACQAMPQTDVKVDVPPESLASTQRLQLEGHEVEVVGPAVIQVCDLHLAAAALNDLRPDASRVRDALADAGYIASRIRPQVLQSISDLLRENGWSIRAVLRQGEVVGLLPEGARPVGLAVDVGTTKVAGYLLDLESGETLGKAGIMNPQISYGEDVISRIAYTDSHDNGRSELHEKMISALNEMIYELCSEAKIASTQIVEAVVVGNTAMHHLFAGLPVHQLAVAPYVPAVGDSLDLSASDLKLAIAPSALLYLPPNVAGFVGADHVAVVLATDLWQMPLTALALDIGTNTEITLAHNHRLLSCSCASGPAFEGAHIRDGMRAAPGAIERMQIVDSEPKVFTIGGRAPVGICGSGILDVVAELIRAGILDRKGMFKGRDKRIRRDPRTNHWEYLLVGAEESGHGRDVVVTRSDVNEIQLAKGAIRAGIEVLLEKADITADQIDQFIVAGAFGTYLDIDSAVTVGMFPGIPRDRFRQVGNAAGTGARQMLISADRRAAADLIRNRIEYIELTTYPGFERVFMDALYFPV